MISPVTVRFADSDPALAHETSFLCRLIAAAVERPVRVVRSADELVDLQLTSVQLPLMRKVALEALRVGRRWASWKPERIDARWRSSNPGPRGSAKAHLWFTGENLRPPAGPWDGYLSFDLDPLGGRNAYVPLWWYSVGLLGDPGSLFTSQTPSWQTMLQRRAPEPDRPGFVCAFMNNPEPMRMHAIRALQDVGPVDVFGSAVGRPVPDKATVARRYRYVLCFENDIYPGYVTEKPFEAWATGAVPLWRGADPAGFLNRDAIVNAAELDSLDGLAARVADLESDRGAWEAMAATPLLSQAPDPSAALELLRRILT